MTAALFWHQVTIFGDVIVTIPAAMVILGWLLTARLWRLAAWWVALFGLGMLLVVISKIAFIGWGIGSQWLDFTGFSGHAMRATAITTVLGYLLPRSTRRLWQMIGITAGVAAGVVVSASRVMVHAHSLSEAVSGAYLGLGLGLTFIALAGSHHKPIIKPWLVLASLLPLLWVSRAAPAPTQEILTRVALRLSGHQQPYTRAQWTRPTPLALHVALVRALATP